MQQEHRVPSNSSDLIKKLDEDNKHKCPTVSMSDREIWIYAGRRELIDQLIRQQEMDEEDTGL